MLRLFFFLGVALLAGGFAAIILRDNPGYVLIEIAGYQVETTLAALVMLLVAVLLALSFSWRFIHSVFLAPKRVAAAMQARRVEKARQQFEKGMLALRNERWQTAELALLKYISDAPAPALSYIAAAEAAHRQNVFQRRDEYLALALEADDKVAPAVEMTRARWAHAQGEWSVALEALDQAQQHKSNSAKAIQAMRLEALEAEGNWQGVSEALPHALGALPRPSLDDINRRAQMALLADAGESGNLDQLRSRWQSLPKALMQDDGVLLIYAKNLHRLGADAEALRLVFARLKKRWDAPLARLYGELHSEDGIAKLAAVEQWINRYGEKAELLLIAGRLCIENRLWGRARSYLENAQRLQPSAAVALELGRLKMQEQDGEGALSAYRAGLEFAVEHEGAQEPSVEAHPALTVDTESSALPGAVLSNDVARDESSR